MHAFVCFEYMFVLIISKSQETRQRKSPNIHAHLSNFVYVLDLFQWRPGITHTNVCCLKWCLVVWRWLHIYSNVFAMFVLPCFIIRLIRRNFCLTFLVLCFHSVVVTFNIYTACNTHQSSDDKNRLNFCLIFYVVCLFLAHTWTHINTCAHHSFTILIYFRSCNPIR